ncbi:MAG: hypothetical protein Q4G19_06280 [Clostridia bacterium]|nr:hypothetical protein [Clostridia bacterium]
MFGVIFTGVVYFSCAVLFFGIGASQVRSERPVGFYSGEKPPEPESLTDVRAWNKKHGTMWILYGFIIIISWLAGFLCGDSPWIMLPYVGGLLVPVIFMILYHHKLVRQYVIR